MEILGGPLFSVAGAGESHGPGITTIVFGCPPGLALGRSEIQTYLDRRRPGGNKHGTPRQESDRVILLSGLYDEDHERLLAGPEIQVHSGEMELVAHGYEQGHTTGEPISALVLSAAKRSADYAQFAGPQGEVRPGHTDLVKYYKSRTFVDVRGGNLHFSCYGFIDIEGAGPGNDLVRCRSPNSQINVQQKFQDVMSCTASRFVAEHAAYPRLIGCDTVGGPVRLCAAWKNKFVTAGRQSPMLAGNRIVLGGADPQHSLTVICSDGLGTAAWNHLYGFDDGAQRSTEMLLFGVGHRDGNRQSWGDWAPVLDAHARPRYLRAWLDMAFKEKYDGAGAE